MALPAESDPSQLVVHILHFYTLGIDPNNMKVSAMTKDPWTVRYFCLILKVLILKQILNINQLSKMISVIYSYVYYERIAAKYHELLTFLCIKVLF